MNAAEIKSMSISERLETMEMIWDSMLENGDDLLSPEWHVEIIVERMKQIEEGTAKYITLDELIAKRK